MAAEMADVADVADVEWLSVDELRSITEAMGGRTALQGKSMLDVYNELVKPWVMEHSQPFIAPHRQRRPASDSLVKVVMVISSWVMPFTDVLSLLEAHAAEHAPLAFWIDIFCINWTVTVGLLGESAEHHERWAAAVCRAAEAASAAVVCCAQWDDMAPIKAIPSLFVLYCMAVKEKGLDVLLLPAEQKRFRSISSDSKLTARALALPDSVRDYDRSLPGSAPLLAELLRRANSFAEALRPVAHLLAHWLHLQLRSDCAGLEARHARIKAATALGLLDDGRLDDAVRLSGEAAADLLRMLGEEHVDSLFALYASGMANAKAKSWVAAENATNRCFLGRLALLGKRSADTLSAMSLLGECKLHLGDLDAAETLLLECIALQKETHVDTQQSLFRLGQFYYDLGKYSHAESAFAEVYTAQRTQLGEAHPSTLQSMLKMAFLYNIQRRFLLAEGMFAAFLKHAKGALGESHRDYQSALQNLANLYFVQWKYEQAEPLYLEIHEHALKHGPVGRSLEAQSALANVYLRTMKHAEAEALFRDCLSRAIALHGPAHPIVQLYRSNYEAAVLEAAEEGGRNPSAAKQLPQMSDSSLTSEGSASKQVQQFHGPADTKPFVGGKTMVEDIRLLDDRGAAQANRSAACMVS